MVDFADLPPDPRTLYVRRNSTGQYDVEVVQVSWITRSGEYITPGERSELTMRSQPIELTARNGAETLMLGETLDERVMLGGIRRHALDPCQRTTPDRLTHFRVSNRG